MRKCPNTGKPCNKVPTVHVTETLHGVTTDKVLCEDCAGPYLKGPASSPGPASANLFDKLFGPMWGAREPDPPEKSCRCGLTLSDFVHKGRLGCDECYATFRSELDTVLPKAGQGSEDHGMEHVGKAPKAGTPSTARVHEDPSKEIERLEGLMAEAVKVENYEAAAQYRDAIKALKPKD